MLYFGGKVPVVTAGTLSEQHIVCPAGGHVLTAEAQIGHRAAFAIRSTVFQIAVRNVIAVAIRPCSIDLIHGCVDGIIRAGDRRRRLRDIPANRCLDSGPSVTEQIVRAAEAWTPVLPQRYVFHRSEEHTSELQS